MKFDKLLLEFEKYSLNKTAKEIKKNSLDDAKSVTDGIYDDKYKEENYDKIIGKFDKAEEKEHNKTAPGGIERMMITRVLNMPYFKTEKVDDKVSIAYSNVFSEDDVKKIQSLAKPIKKSYSNVFGEIEAVWANLVCEGFCAAIYYSIVKEHMTNDEDICKMGHDGAAKVMEGLSVEGDHPEMRELCSLLNRVWNSNTRVNEIFKPMYVDVINRIMGA
jgi:hypothetical protein